MSKSFKEILSLRESLSLIASKLHEGLEHLSQIIQKYVDIHQLESKVSELESKVSELVSKISEIESKVSELQQSENQKKSAQVSLTNQSQVVSESSLSDFQNISISSNLQDIVDKFNERNKDHFTRLSPQFLKLNVPSIHGVPSPTGSTIVQLVSAQENEASYLKIEADQENWLFPNIISAQVDKIISILKPSIFTIDFSLKNPQLKKPAKLKEVSSGIWEIAEIGEFET